jgi:hypothetical protein
MIFASAPGTTGSMHANLNCFRRVRKKGQTTLSTAACLHGVNSLQAGTEQSDPFFSTLQLLATSGHILFALKLKSSNVTHRRTP